MANAEARQRVPFSYVFGPFALDSELELPELQVAASESRLPGERVPVTIRLLSPLHAGFDSLPDMVRIDEWISASPQAFLLNIPGVGSFLARDGCQVDVAPEAGAAEVDLRLYLLGSVFGALCHQNGLLPLHASAVARQGKVTAFLGDSGAGKSTLAAFLARRGHTIIADDICLLGAGEDAGLSVIPVAGWLKLWRASLDSLGEDALEANRLLSEEDKFRVYLPAAGGERPRLDCLVLLERPAASDLAAAPRLMPVSAAAAVAHLMDMTYLPQLARVAGRQADLFRRCARIVGEVRILRLSAPLGWDHMPEVLDLIEAELLPGAGNPV